MCKTYAQSCHQLTKIKRYRYEGSGWHHHKNVDTSQSFVIIVSLDHFDWDMATGTGISSKSSQRIGARGYHNLAPRDIDCRNERFRLIAFQNIQKILKRSSINIFLDRSKLTENRKFRKFLHILGSHYDLLSIPLKI